MSQNPSPGRIVHVRIGGPDDIPDLRPAIVVRDWGGGTVNLQLFLDGTNDRGEWDPSTAANKEPSHGLYKNADCDKGSAWLTSILEGEGVGEWRWPART